MSPFRLCGTENTAFSLKNYAESYTVYFPQTPLIVNCQAKIMMGTAALARPKPSWVISHHHWWSLWLYNDIYASTLGYNGLHRSKWFHAKSPIIVLWLDAGSHDKIEYVQRFTLWIIVLGHKPSNYNTAIIVVIAASTITAAHPSWGPTVLDRIRAYRGECWSGKLWWDSDGTVITRHTDFQPLG